MYNFNVKNENVVFSDQDIRKLKDSENDAAKIVLMLIYTGLRASELFNLPIKSYYDTYIVVKSEKMTGETQEIPLNKAARKYFKYFKDIATGDLLLSGYTGHHTLHDFTHHDFLHLMKELKITKISLHTARHTYLESLLKIGKDLAKCAET